MNLTAFSTRTPPLLFTADEVRLNSFDKPINHTFPRHEGYELVLFQSGTGEQQVDF